MGFCAYCLAGIICAIFMTWLLPYVERLTYYAPNIVSYSTIPHIEGTSGKFYSQDPPLYKALMKKLEKFSTPPTPSQTQIKPLFDEKTYATFFITNDEKNLQTLVIRNDVPTHEKSNPYVSEITLYKHSLQSFFYSKVVDQPWSLLWTSEIPGIIYAATVTYSGEDLALVYSKSKDEGTHHHIRYYPDRNSSHYEDIELPGNAEVQAISVMNDTFIYSRKGDLRKFRTLQRVSKDYLEEYKNNSVIYQDDEIAWVSGLTGEEHDRQSYKTSEVVGLKLTHANDQDWLTQITINIPPDGLLYGHSQADFYYKNSTGWERLENFTYNLTFVDMLLDYDDLELMNRPVIKVSKDGRHSIIGHYGKFLSAVSWRYNVYRGAE